MNKPLIGNSSKVYNAIIREDVTIGEECIIGQGVYIDNGVTIGNRCKIQNYACIYGNTVIEDGVFIGPGVIVCNDLVPRAINPDGTLKKSGDWIKGNVRICYGAAIGAGAVILPNVVIGKWAMIGAGAVVLHSVSDYIIAVGNPAQSIARIKPEYGVR